MSDINKEKFIAELLCTSVEKATPKLLDNIKSWWIKKGTGITTIPAEANQIEDIAKTEFYKIVKANLGMHWSIPLLKVGLYIEKLSIDGNNKRAKEMSNEAYSRWGPKGKRIIQIATTGVLVHILDHIIDLKKYKNANPLVLQEEFNKILDEWIEISIPISNESSEEDIKTQILEKIQNRLHIFFVYGSGYAAIKGDLLIAKMNNDGLFKHKYLFWPKKRVSSNGVEFMLWYFEISEPIEPKEETSIKKIYNVS